MEKFFVIVFYNKEQMWLNAHNIVSVFVQTDKNIVEVRSIIQGQVVCNKYEGVDINKTQLV